MTNIFDTVEAKIAAWIKREEAKKESNIAVIYEEKEIPRVLIDIKDIDREVLFKYLSDNGYYSKVFKD